MLGVIVNTIGIVVGSFIGLFFRQKLPRKVIDAVMGVMGLTCFFIGIKGALKGENAIVMVVSLVIGTAVGTIIDVEKYINKIGEFLKKKYAKKDKTSKDNFVEAFVSASILFGVGAMAVVGSINAGLKHDYSILFLKSTLDFVTSIMYAASMGIGVIFSSITIFVFQGLLVLLSSQLKFLAENEIMMNELVCVGNIMIIAIGLNMLGLTKIKIGNMLPAIIIAPIVVYIISLL